MYAHTVSDVLYTRFICTHIEVLHVHVHVYVGNHTYASARGHETFEFLRDCFAPVWKEVDELTSNPTLCVNDVQYSLQVVFGADYKVRMHIRTHVCVQSFTNPFLTVPSADDGVEQCHLNLLLYLVYHKQGAKVNVHVGLHLHTCMCIWCTCTCVHNNIHFYYL